jgi:hypothetical protein
VQSMIIWKKILNPGIGFGVCMSTVFRAKVALALIGAVVLAAGRVVDPTLASLPAPLAWVAGGAWALGVTMNDESSSRRNAVTASLVLVGWSLMALSTMNDAGIDPNLFPAYDLFLVVFGGGLGYQLLSSIGPFANDSVDPAG